MYLYLAWALQITRWNGSTWLSSQKAFGWDFSVSGWVHICHICTMYSKWSDLAFSLKVVWKWSLKIWIRYCQKSLVLCPSYPSTCIATWSSSSSTSSSSSSSSSYPYAKVINLRSNLIDLIGNYYKIIIIIIIIIIITNKIIIIIIINIIIVIIIITIISIVKVINLRSNLIDLIGNYYKMLEDFNLVSLDLSDNRISFLEPQIFVVSGFVFVFLFGQFSFLEPQIFVVSVFVFVFGCICICICIRSNLIPWAKVLFGELNEWIWSNE